MFDFSFGELLVVALVALVVLGPERLPKAARFTGLWVRKARAQWYSVKAELENELASEELKRSLHDGKQAIQETERQLHDLAADTRRDIETGAAAIKAEAALDAEPAIEAAAVIEPEPAHDAEPPREPRDV